MLLDVLIFICYFLKILSCICITHIKLKMKTSVSNNVNNKTLNIEYQKKM